MALITLPRSAAGNLLIRPRWPARVVLVDAAALEILQEIQTGLPSNIQLVITRGFEPGTSGLGFARRLFRRFGMFTFAVLYPRRRNEIDAIFESNGHDVDGTHIDLSICLSGRRIRLLPFGVFTPLWLQRQRSSRIIESLTIVQAAISHAGFDIHVNATERLQMHCDLRNGSAARTSITHSSS